MKSIGSTGLAYLWGKIKSYISGLGFYTKPSTGIPATDIASGVIPTVPTKVSDLTNDSGFTSNVGTITGITMNGASKGTSGVVDLGTVLTEHQDISGKQDALVSGTNIKTINNESILGSGNLDISAGGSYIAYPSFNIDNSGHLIMTDGAEGLFTIENGHLKYNF